jgi:predicted metalloprotease
MGSGIRSVFAHTIVSNVLCATQSFAGLEVGEFLVGSGNRELDGALSSEMTTQSAFFGYRPAFVLYRGGEKNAAATTERRPEYQETNGTILYNLELLTEQLGVSHWGGTIVAGVVAHEFGHIHQYFSGYMERLRSMDSTVKFVELHADFLSGFYMGGKSGTISITDYTNAFFDIGDNQVKNADHHGTPEERFLAIKGGFNYRVRNKSRNVAQAAQEAEGFLREYIHR